MLATEREAFELDGAAVLRGVFKDWVEPLREGVEYNATHPGPSFRNYTPEKTTGRFFGDYCNWQRIEPFRDFVEHSPAASVAQALMGSQRARIFHE
ncbi:MAG TPA: phytanoyl-CoA dioxygenase, partial [Caballeronia sp.]|nr:phytanoyl-CoA dioxygenase [Caballeronia sp.]